MSCLASAAWLLASFAPLQTQAPPGVVTVRSETGEPLPGAEVFGFDRRDLMSFMLVPQGDSLDEVIERLGTRLVAGADGTIRVPAELECLWGRSGARRGALEPGSQPLPPSLVLEPCPEVKVRVTGADGEPAAGARVAVHGYMQGAQLWSIGVGKTDAAGELAFVHFFPLIEGLEIERWSVALDVLGAAPVEAAYDPAAPPAEPLVLTRPPVGAVVLRSVDEQGEQITLDQVVEIFAEGGSERLRSGMFAVGRLDLDQVLVGARLKVVPIPLGGWRAQELAVEGPLKPGEVREYALAFAPAPASPGKVRISARLLDPEERPIAGEMIQCSVTGAGEEWSTNEWMAATGLMDLEVERGLLERGTARLTLLVEREDGSALWRKLELPKPEEDRLELGDTLLEAAPLLLSGRVVDAAGGPVPGAEVQVSGVSEVQPVEEQQARAIRSLARLRLRTDAEGRFEVRGIDQGLRYEARREVRAVAADRGRTRWVDCGAPAEEVVLKLGEPALLSGRVLLDDGIDPTLLRIDACYRGETPQENGAGGARVERDGSFRFGASAGEACDLALWIDPEKSIALPFSGEPDLVLEDVRPGAEETAWDLRGKLYAYELTVLLPDGEPAASPNLHYKSGRKQLVRLYSGKHGRPIQVLSIDRPLEVRVEEKGFRAASITLAGPRGELKLAGGIPVKLSLTNQPDLGEDGFLAASLSVRSPSYSSSRSPEGVLDEHGAAELLVLEPGTYTVTFQYRRRVGAMVWFGATSWEAKEPLPEIEITGEEGQAFALTLPDDLVEVFRREAERDL